MQKNSLHPGCWNYGINYASVSKTLHSAPQKEYIYIVSSTIPQLYTATHIYSYKNKIKKNYNHKRFRLTLALFR